MPSVFSSAGQNLHEKKMANLFRFSYPDNLWLLASLSLPLFQPDVTPAISSISKAELLAQTLATFLHWMFQGLILPLFQALTTSC